MRNNRESTEGIHGWPVSEVCLPRLKDGQGNFHETQEGGYAVAYSGNIGIDNAAFFEKCAAQLDQKASDHKTPQEYPRKLVGVEISPNTLL